MVLDTAKKVEDKSLESEDKPKGSPKAKETTPQSKEPAPKMFSEEEHKRLVEEAVHDALMKRGRDWKTLELERDSLSNQLEAEKEHGARFELQLDELANENPDKFDAIKKFKELDKIEKALKQEQEQFDSRMRQERETFESERKGNEELLKSARNTQRETDCFEIAEQFAGGDASRLKELAEVMKLDSSDKILKVAETLWTKKNSQEANLKLDSGITIGGVSEETIRKNYRENPDDPKAKSEYFEYRRKKGI